MTRLEALEFQRESLLGFCDKLEAMDRFPITARPDGNPHSVPVATVRQFLNIGLLDGTETQASA